MWIAWSLVRLARHGGISAVGWEDPCSDVLFRRGHREQESLGQILTGPG